MTDRARELAKMLGEPMKIFSGSSTSSSSWPSWPSWSGSSTSSYTNTSNSSTSSFAGPINVTYYIGMMINLGGFIQWILKCRIADLQAKLHSFHLLMRFPLMYLFVLFCTLFVSLHIKLQEYLILICSEELDSIIQMLR